LFCLTFCASHRTDTVRHTVETDRWRPIDRDRSQGQRSTGCRIRPFRISARSNPATLTVEHKFYRRTRRRKEPLGAIDEALRRKMRTSFVRGIVRDRVPGRHPPEPLRLRVREHRNRGMTPIPFRAADKSRLECYFFGTPIRPRGH
jgi:hypothetical protein